MSKKIIKAVTLWQPWASLIAKRLKKIETRSWPTNYRGPIAIHAAKKKPIPIEALNWPLDVRVEVLAKVGRPKYLPRGHVLALADLVDCRPTEKLIESVNAVEVFFGDYSPGRYGWLLDNIREIEPYKIGGRQGLWNFDMDLIGKKRLESQKWW